MMDGIWMESYIIVIQLLFVNIVLPLEKSFILQILHT